MEIVVPLLLINDESDPALPGPPEVAAAPPAPIVTV
jgi:hypothetical protein